MSFFIKLCVIFIIVNLINCNVIREIVVRILGDENEARILARETGFIFKGPVLAIPNTYIFIPLDNSTYPNHQKRGLTLAKRLSDDHRVLWADQQVEISRQKRDFQFGAPPPANEADLERKIYKKPLKPKLDNTFNDELWSQEWYLQDTRSEYNLPKLDLNVLPVYQRGITGKGVRISILDDGIEYTHDDLKDNYDPTISYDCNDDDPSPLPRYTASRANSHGTRCAGEVAMAADNRKCGVGVAHGARVGGVRLLDGAVSDRVEGAALAFARARVHVYSASWGPNDDGRALEGPGRLAAEALRRGAAEGRGGRGAVFVWAAGNGGGRADACGCDGYVGSPFTVAVGSASQRGRFPWYGEACAAMVAVTYSSGAYRDQMIVTTDLHNECTIKHTGTSASAPLAAGIIALALEANPELTWRDVQHLIVWSSEMAPLADNSGWQQNAIGLWFNTKFGFGLMNAFGLVMLAANWTNVADRHTCTVYDPKFKNSTISYTEPSVIDIFTTGCKNTPNHVVYLEHVELEVTIKYPIRGALQIFLTSPSGSGVEMLAPRKFDTSSEGFKKWRFMSMMTWGEATFGKWTVTVLDLIGPEGNKGSVEDVSLILHGTSEQPQHMSKGPRNYNNNYNKVHNRYFDYVSSEVGNDADIINDEMELNEINKKLDDYYSFNV